MGSKAREPKQPLCVGVKPWLVIKPLSLLFIYSSIIVGKTCYFWCHHLFANSRFKQLRTQISIQKTTSLPHFFRHLRYSDSSKSSSPPTKWSLVEFCSQHVSKHYNPWIPETNSSPWKWVIGRRSFCFEFRPNSGTFVVSFRRFQCEVQCGGPRFGPNLSQI